MKVDTRWSFEGFPVLRLENEALTVDVLPDLGGKILQITHRTLSRSEPKQGLEFTERHGRYAYDIVLLPFTPTEIHRGRTIDHGLVIGHAWPNRVRRRLIITHIMGSSISGLVRVEGTLPFADRTRMSGARPRKGCWMVGKTAIPMTAPAARRAREMPAAFRHLLLSAPA